MELQTDYLEHLAAQLAAVSDTERLDLAAEMAVQLRKLTDLLATGELEASAELQANYAGVLWALEAITAGRKVAPAGDTAADALTKETP